MECQVQNVGAPAYEPTYVGVEHDATIYHPMPSGRQNFYVNEPQTFLGKRSFQAKVTKSLPDGYTTETVTDGKPLCGVLFSNKPISKNTVDNDSNRKMEATGNDRTKKNDNHSTAEESAKHVEHYLNDVKQTNGFHDRNGVPEVQMEAATAEKKNPGQTAGIQDTGYPCYL